MQNIILVLSGLIAVAFAGYAGKGAFILERKWKRKR